MKTTRMALAVLALVALVALAGCSSSADNLRGDGLHATVPNVVGMSLDNATEKLHDSGYEIGSVAPAGSDGASVVRTQQPVAGTALPRGNQVSVQCAGY